MRTATADDYKFAYQTKKVAFREYVEQVHPWDEDEQRRLHERRFVSQDFRVIQVAGIDVGILAMNREPDCLKLNQLFILPEFQGRGIGTACLRSVIDEATTGGLSIRLQVLQVNHKAMEFFQ